MDGTDIALEGCGHGGIGGVCSACDSRCIVCGRERDDEPRLPGYRCRACSRAFTRGVYAFIRRVTGLAR